MFEVTLYQFGCGLESEAVGLFERTEGATAVEGSAGTAADVNLHDASVAEGAWHSIDPFPAGP
jgi:hypothetical protein